QAGIDGEPCLDTADDLLHPWQRGERRAEVGRHAIFQEIDQPVTCGTRDAVIDRRNEDRMDSGLGEIRHAPLFRLAHIDLVVEWKYDVLEYDVMAAAGAQPEMVPGLDDPRARQSSRHEKQADAQLRLIGFRPYRVPFQNRRSGRID